MVSEFSAWFNKEVQERGWTFREVARRGGINNSTISLVASEQRNPGLSFCVRVAHAFGMRPERVLRIAGLLPPLPPPVAEEDEVMVAFRRLGPTDRDALIRMLRGLSAGGTVPLAPRGSASSIVTEPRPPEHRTREELLQYCAARLEEIVPEEHYDLLITVLRHFAQVNVGDKTVESVR